MKDSDVRQLLAAYPKIRPSLSEAYQRVYLEEYRRNRSGQGMLFRVTQMLESWMHENVAKVPCNHGSMLEIGGGTLNHVPYERGFERYDCVEPFEELYANAENRSAIRHFYQSINEIPLIQKYRKIFSIAVLEHIENLPAVLAKAGALLDTEGVFQAGIPTEGGFLWGLSWRLTTGPYYRLRTGLDYKTLMRHEHINDAVEVCALIRYFFGSVEIRRFPTPWHHLSFYSYIEARQPNLDRCLSHLSNRF